MPRATIFVSEDKDINNPNSVSFEERKKDLEKIDKMRQKEAKARHNSPFRRWTQFNLEHTEKMMWLQLKYPKAAAILSFLVDQMDEYNAVMCSSKVLEELLGISRQTISKNIAILKENGYIAVLKSGASNVYTVNDTVYWKSWGDNRKYSKFPANVVLALSEQENNYQVSFADLEKTRHKEISVKPSSGEKEIT